MFKVKKIDLDIGHNYVVALTRDDMVELSLNGGDRVKVINKKNNKHIVCVLDVVNGNSGVKSGTIGVFDKVFEKLELVENQTIDIAPSEKPSSIEYLKQKIEGKRLGLKEFTAIIQDIIDNKFSQIETTFFVTVCSLDTLDDDETIALTQAMVDCGKILDFTNGDKSKIVVDKHCIGGLAGNRTTMIVTPIVAAAGLIMPKTSSRAITSPAGTADTMEILTNVEISTSEMFEQVKKIGACVVWGGAVDLSPADDIIINVEHPLEIDCEGQMIASVLSKKKSAGSTHVLIDIPVGPTAKVKTHKEAERLGHRFTKVGRAIGLNIKVIVTDGIQPIGSGIGPLYEAEDVLKVLKNDENCDKTLRNKSVMMAGIIFDMAGITKSGQGESLAEDILTSGRAYDKMNEIIDSQGRKVIPSYGKYSYVVTAPTSGIIKSINNQFVSKTAFTLGAPKDNGAGLILHKKLHDFVKEGEELFTIYSNSEMKLKYAKAFIYDNEIYYI